MANPLIDPILGKYRSLFWPAIVKEMKKRAATSAPKLVPVQDHTSKIRPGDRLLMTMGRDENPRIPFFLEYYRGLGIDHFLFVDNESEIPMAEVLAGHPDVSLWRTDESYAATRFGVDWMNAINSRHGVGHWVLTVDLDEFFVYPRMRTRSYGELLAYLQDAERQSMFTLMVDLYPKGAVADAHVEAGEAPWNHARYFDRIGYYTARSTHKDSYTRGGPRLRAFNAGNFAGAPALNKTPLIKWRQDTVYYLSTHVAYPTSINAAHNKQCQPTGALLHCKFVSSFREKAEQAIRLKNHYNESGEYLKYLDRLRKSEEFSLFTRISAEYTGPDSLVEAGIMTSGGWS